MKPSVLAVALAFALGALAWSVSSQLMAQSNPLPHCEDAMTVFHDVSGFGRKRSAAKNMTERHAEMRLQGWKYVDKVIYTENGDLEGFFITYVRDGACE